MDFSDGAYSGVAGNWVLPHARQYSEMLKSDTVDFTPGFVQF